VAAEPGGVETRDPAEVDAEVGEVASVADEQAPRIPRAEPVPVGDAQVAARSATASARAQLESEAERGEQRHAPSASA
jgi:hypothetical protein